MPFLRVIFHHVIRRLRAYAGGAAVCGAVVGYLFLLPPSGFPAGSVIVVPDDASFGETAAMLEELRVVRSAFLLKAVARIGHADRQVQAGRYVFTEPMGMTSVLYRLAHGISGIPSLRVTFPEGYSAREMADTLAAAIPGFDAAAFLKAAAPYEGYLFPDTYMIAYDATPEEIVVRLRTTFDMKIEELHEAFSRSTRSKEDIVIMASILEKEAKGREDMRVVSGILWNRVALNRALQVDAVFGYIKGVDTYHPSGEDLEIESPYNTYLYPGLPPGPIGNPGIEALTAAAAPVETDNLYYLTGRDGQMRYAKTFEEHKENRERYLD
jgi:UPF0755 protein